MSLLFEPLTLRATTLPNRLVLPAMVTRLSGEDGHVNDDIRERYVRFARGGVGLAVVEAMAVHGSKSGPLLRISSDELKPGLTDLAARMHDAGPGKVAPQIIHFLKISRSGWRQTIDMLSLDEIDAIVEAYGAAARRARECGFDAVELHMAHAYTLSSFLSRMNARKDDYGGSLENRLRLPIRVLHRVRAEVGADFTVGVRFVGDECIRNGYTTVDAGPIAVRLAQEGADWISLSAGGKFEDARRIEGEPLEPTCEAAVASFTEGLTSSQRRQLAGVLSYRPGDVDPGAADEDHSAAVRVTCLESPGKAWFAAPEDGTWKLELPFCSGR